jgi:predicted dehydrogenase
LKSLRAGIAGYGVVGERRHKVIDEHPNLCLAAIADLKFDEQTPHEGEVSYFKKYQDMIDDAALDVLFVSLPNDAAPDATIAGLEAGCHVFCEKPPGRTVDDVKRVIAAEGRAPGLKLKYGFNHRYHDSVREALRIAKSGELGAVVNIRVRALAELFGGTILANEPRRCGGRDSARSGNPHGGSDARLCGGVQQRQELRP